MVNRNHIHEPLTMNHQKITMNINRNNYEEYFLLYIDNELSLAEKNMVDEFVAAHPDLQEELVMLQQSVIKPADIEFDGKEDLLKPEPVDAATEEKLLLLLDNELRGKEKAAVLSLIQYNTAVKKEWEILQQTKYSSSETIVFKDKATLYRKEEGKVVAIGWWRVAAAAMLIGFGLWGAVSYLNGSKQDNQPAETAGFEVKSKTGNNNAIQNVTKGVQQNQPVNTVSDDTSLPNTTAATADNNKKETFSPTVNKGKTAIKQTNRDTQNDVAGMRNENNTPESLETINNNDSNEKVFVTVTPGTQTNNIQKTVQIPSVAPKSFKNNAGDNNTIAFEEDEDKPRKTKLGGFFKRVKRVIERKTKINTGDDDEVRIANMSFAMH